MKILATMVAFILGALSISYTNSAQAQQAFPYLCGPVTSIRVPGTSISGTPGQGTEYGYKCSDGSLQAASISATQNANLPPAAFAMITECFGGATVAFVVNKSHPNWQEAYLAAQASFLGEKPIAVTAIGLSGLAPQCSNQSEQKYVVIDPTEIAVWTPTP